MHAVRIAKAQRAKAVGHCFSFSTRCEGESSKGTITRPHAHAGLAAGETKCEISNCFTDGFQNDLQFGSKSPKGMINKPYAHAGLAAGEAQPGWLSDENCVAWRTAAIGKIERFDKPIID